MTGFMQWYECPPTCNTRLTDGTSVARDAAGACEQLAHVDFTTHHLYP